MAPSKSIGARVKRKSFVSIFAPRLFSGAFIGETPVADAKSLVGKRISANFMMLTNDFKRQHISLKFMINEIKEGKAHTILTGYEVAPSFIKRLVRRGRTKIPDSFVITTQDGVKVRVKPVLITQSRVSSGTSTQLRLSFRSQLTELASKETFSSLIAQFLDGRLQKHFRQSLGKIAVLKHFEIKAFFAEGEAKESEVTLESGRERPVEQAPIQAEPVVEAPSEEAAVAVEPAPKKRAKKAAPEAEA